MGSSSTARSAATAMIALVAAIIALLTGTLGLGLPLTAVAVLVGAVALGAGIALRARGAEGSGAEGERTATRDVRWVAPAGALLGAASLLVLLVVAEGEARDHGFLHLRFGLAHLALFAAVAWTWRPAPGSATAQLRGSLMVVLAVSSAAAFLESVGAAGYDRANLDSRIGWLTALHNATAPVQAVGVLAIPIAAASLVVLLVARLTRRRRPLDPPGITPA